MGPRASKGERERTTNLALLLISDSSQVLQDVFVCERKCGAGGEMIEQMLN